MFDILRAWNGFCLENNNILDCIYPINSITDAVMPHKCYKILDYTGGTKTYDNFNDVLDDINFDNNFFFEYVEKILDRFLIVGYNKTISYFEGGNYNENHEKYVLQRG